VLKVALNTIKQANKQKDTGGLGLISRYNIMPDMYYTTNYDLNILWHWRANILKPKFKWVRECGLTPNKQFCRYIMTRTSYFDDMLMMIMSSLCYANTLSWIFIVFALGNSSLWVNMSLYSDTLTWVRANQLLFLLLTVAWLAKEQQQLILLSLVGPTWTGIILICELYSRQHYVIKFVVSLGYSGPLHQ
jgi:hypothetical protein